MTADAVCPGGWPWAVSLLGVAVGLLPAAGAAAVALWRRRIGSRYGPAESVVLAGAGLLACGVLPLLVFLATGRVFTAAAGSGRVPGLTARQLRDLDSAVCVVGAQSSYLGRGSVAAAFTAAGPVRAGLAVLALVGLPAVVALFTAASARLALRRGPRWPAKFFWLPVLAVAVLTTDVPAGLGGAPVARRVGRGVARDPGGAVAGRAGVGGRAPVPGAPATGRSCAVGAVVRLPGTAGVPRPGAATRPGGAARRTRAGRVEGAARVAVRRPRPGAGRDGAGGSGPASDARGRRRAPADPRRPGRWAGACRRTGGPDAAAALGVPARPGSAWCAGWGRVASGGCGSPTTPASGTRWR